MGIMRNLINRIKAFPREVGQTGVAKIEQAKPRYPTPFSRNQTPTALSPPTRQCTTPPTVLSTRRRINRKAWNADHPGRRVAARILPEERAPRCKTLFRDKVMEIIAANGMWIAGGVAAIAGLGMLLGILKKLAAAMLTGSLNAGDWLAHKLAEKPKAVAWSSAFALTITGLWAFHTFTAAKIIEKPVIQM